MRDRSLGKPSILIHTSGLERRNRESNNVYMMQEYEFSVFVRLSLALYDISHMYTSFTWSTTSSANAKS
jgi:hypothetical protein